MVQDRESNTKYVRPPCHHHHHYCFLAYMILLSLLKDAKYLMIKTLLLWPTNIVDYCPDFLFAGHITCYQLEKFHHILARV